MSGHTKNAVDSASDTAAVGARAHARSLRALHPDNPRFAHLTDEDRLIVSEPLSDLPGVWLEIPESTAVIVQPGADEQNEFLERHGWDEYAKWHLGLTEGASDETKARYAFVYGDFRRVHRSGLIACVYRASEWRHKAIELAAHDLLQHLDEVSG